MNFPGIPGASRNEIELKQAFGGTFVGGTVDIGESSSVNRGESSTVGDITEGRAGEIGLKRGEALSARGARGIALKGGVTADEGGSEGGIRD